jgi:hypothetical protein
MIRDLPSKSPTTYIQNYFKYEEDIFQYEQVYVFVLEVMLNPKNHNQLIILPSTVCNGLGLFTIERRDTLSLLYATKETYVRTLERGDRYGMRLPKWPNHLGQKPYNRGPYFFSTKNVYNNLARYVNNFNKNNMSTETHKLFANLKSPNKSVLKLLESGRMKLQCTVEMGDELFCRLGLRMGAKISLMKARKKKRQNRKRKFRQANEEQDALQEQ